MQKLGQDWWRWQAGVQLRVEVLTEGEENIWTSLLGTSQSSSKHLSPGITTTSNSGPFQHLAMTIT